MAKVSDAHIKKVLNVYERVGKVDDWIVKGVSNRLAREGKLDGASTADIIYAYEAPYVVLAWDDVKARAAVVDAELASHQ